MVPGATGGIQGSSHAGFGKISREHPYRQLNLFTRNLQIEAWDENAARHYGRIRAELKQRGLQIGNNDLLIAAHARSLNAILVSNNLREFKRVPLLKLENW